MIKTKHQAGYVFESKSDTFHVRYYVTEIVNGQSVRRQRSHMLCRKDAQYTSKSCKPVKLLRDDFMKKINVTNSVDMSIVDFWEQTYLPFIQTNMKASTVCGYRQIWNQHLSGTSPE